jgi:hypothetical protein
VGGDAGHGKKRWEEVGRGGKRVEGLKVEGLKVEGLKVEGLKVGREEEEV